MRTLIENGIVADGTGRQCFRGFVVLSGDRIVDVARGAFPDGARSGFDMVVDADGCVVTPGFIDAHSHSDAYLVVEPDAPSKLSQGITTEINGQCGGSVAPRYG